MAVSFSNMLVRLITSFLVVLVLTGCVRVTVDTDERTFPQASNELPRHKEACFDLAEVYVGVDRYDGYVSDYFAQHEVKAAINGGYYAADDNQPQGVLYTPLTGVITSQRGLVTGYGVIRNDVFEVRETIEGVQGYQLVVGTHPLLLDNGEVSAQVDDLRYAGKQSFRSALATRTGDDMCLIVSQDIFTMRGWAEFLKEQSFYEAINLDGGAVTQMTDAQGSYGPAFDTTRSVIYIQ